MSPCGAYSPPVSTSAGLHARLHPLTRGRDAATAGGPAAPAASPRLLMLAVHAADTDADDGGRSLPRVPGPFPPAASTVALQRASGG